MSLLSCPCPARAWVLPDTGQTKCYNAAGAEIACANSGQDGAYNGSQPHYNLNVNANTTVTDLNTGLMWQRADDGVTRTWAAAGTYCSGLGLEGFSDWRLPTQPELLTIVNAGAASPACPAALTCRADWYWSSTSFAADSSHAWPVSFGVGYEYWLELTNPHYVRCVRGGP